MFKSDGFVLVMVTDYIIACAQIVHKPCINNMNINVVCILILMGRIIGKDFHPVSSTLILMIDRTTS